MACDNDYNCNSCNYGIGFSECPDWTKKRQEDELKTFTTNYYNRLNENVLKLKDRLNKSFEFNDDEVDYLLDMLYKNKSDDMGLSIIRKIESKMKIGG